MARKKILKNKTQIVDAAFRLTETEGIDAVSMIRLSKELGVSSMTLYNYVRNADEILREMLILTLSDFFEHLYSILCNKRYTEESAIQSYALAYALALYDLAEQHRDICQYMIGGGYARFHHDAELRPFYEPFDHFLLFSSEGKREARKELYLMFRGLVFSLIYEHILGSNRFEQEEYLRMVNRFVDRMFNDDQET